MGPMPVTKTCGGVDLVHASLPSRACVSTSASFTPFSDTASGSVSTARSAVSLGT